MAVTIIIPTVSDYRYHLRLVTTYILAHLSIDDNGNKYPVDFDGVVDLDSVFKLTKKLAAAKPTKDLKLSLNEGLLFYSCFVLMNKVLVSKNDELLSKEFLKGLPDNHYLKDFKAFRDEMLHINMHLIEDTEKKFRNNKHLTLLKQRLLEIELD